MGIGKTTWQLLIVARIENRGIIICAILKPTNREAAVQNLIEHLYVVSISSWTRRPYDVVP